MPTSRKKGDRCGRFAGCVPLSLIGLALILLGAVLLILFVPFETWLAVIGVALIVGGILLRVYSQGSV